MDSDSSRTKLRISKDPMYLLLREGCIKEFNVKKAAGDKCDLRGCDLRGLDLRGWMPMGWTSAIAISDNPTYAAWT